MIRKHTLRPEFTARQREVWRAGRDLAKKLDRSPTLAEIAQKAGCHESYASIIIQRLIDLGYATRETGKHGTLKFVRDLPREAKSDK